jgi:hypothetical protein
VNVANIGAFVDRVVATFARDSAEDNSKRMYFRIKAGPRSRTTAAVGPQVWYEGEEEEETKERIFAIINGNKPGNKVFQVLAFYKGETAPFDTVSMENPDYVDDSIAAEWGISKADPTGLGMQAGALVRLAESANQRTDEAYNTVRDIMGRMAKVLEENAELKARIFIAQERGALSDEQANQRMLELGLGTLKDILPDVIVAFRDYRKAESVATAISVLEATLRDNPELVASREGQEIIARITRSVQAAGQEVARRKAEADAKAKAEQGGQA